MDVLPKSSEVEGLDAIEPHQGGTSRRRLSSSNSGQAWTTMIAFRPESKERLRRLASESRSPLCSAGSNSSDRELERGNWWDSD